MSQRAWDREMRYFGGERRAGSVQGPGHPVDVDEGRLSVTRVDNDNGKETLHTVDEAHDGIEGSGYYKEGTIDECIEIGKDFTLRTPWAYWRFEL